MRRSVRLALALVLACGCAAGTPSSRSAREEIVVDEATVVQGRRPGAGGVALPPLPEPLANTSPAFQRGFARAQTLLRAPGPAAPPEQDDERAERAWLDTEFKPWLEQRLAAIIALVEDFAAMAPAGGTEPPHERVVAVALLGLVNGRAFDQLAQIPAPPRVRADPALLRVYQNELNTTLAGGLLESSITAHRSCASGAAEQSEQAFGPWLELCHAQLAGRLQQQAQALALRDAVELERAAERRAAEGERPPGPIVCWNATTTPAQTETSGAALESHAGGAATAAATPGASEQASTAPNATAPAQIPSPATAGASGEARANAGAASATPRNCALAADARDPLADRALSARDARYGARDTETGVRVWAALGDNPDVDAQPLAWLATQQRLARCFAEHVQADRAITIAVHVRLNVNGQGRTQSVTLGPEPSDASAAPAPALSQCMRRALKETAFACSATGRAAHADATYCLRRD